MKKQVKVSNMRFSTYRRYRRQEDGTLKFMGVVRYQLPVEAADDALAALRDEIAERDAWNAERNAAECEDFESLVDAACEMEGM